MEKLLNEILEQIKKSEERFAEEVKNSHKRSAESIEFAYKILKSEKQYLLDLQDFLYTPIKKIIDERLTKIKQEEEDSQETLNNSQEKDLDITKQIDDLFKELTGQFKNLNHIFKRRD